MKRPGSCDADPNKCPVIFHLRQNPDSHDTGIVSASTLERMNAADK
jgi:hypothetical protein